MTTTIFIFRSIISHIDSLSVVSLSISCFLLIDISRFLFLFVNVSLFCLCVNIVYFLLLFNEDFSRSLSLTFPFIKKHLISSTCIFSLLSFSSYICVYENIIMVVVVCFVLLHIERKQKIYIYIQIIDHI